MIKIFIYIIFFFSFYLPEIKNVEISQIMLWLIFLFYYIKKPKISKEVLYLIIFSFIQIILVIFFYNERLINHYQNSIDSKWFEIMKYSIDTYLGGNPQFYHKQFPGITNAIRLIEYALIYDISLRSLNKEKYITIKNILLVNTIIQTIIMIYQKIEYGWSYRAGGTIGHPQAVGGYCLILFAFYLTEKKALKKYLIYISIISLTIMSSSRSTFATLITVYFLQNYLKILTELFYVFNLFFSVIFSQILLFKEIFFRVLNLFFKSLHTLEIRYLMWTSSYKVILKENFLLGSKGILSYFPDNIIWYFLQPYGVLGLTVYTYFFYKLLKLDKKKINILLFGFIFQGLTFYGFMVVPLAHVFWSSLGIFVKLEKDEIL